METNETVLKEIDFMQIGGFKVGHAEDQEAGTGCTVLLFDNSHLPAWMSAAAVLHPEKLHC